MDEIRAVPWNGLTVASTFSGAGGSCLGFRMAGYRVPWASEFVEEARETYRANAPDTTIDPRDIREVQPEDVVAACGGVPDVLEGSPPCNPFSTAGKRQATWGRETSYLGGKKRQRVDDLFFEFARLLGGVRPRAFVAENVSGLVKGAAKGYFKEILRALRAAGYRVRAQLLDAQWLGVPQARQRVIFVGLREDLELEPSFPPPLPYRYSLRDACPWIQHFRGEQHGPRSFEPPDFPSETGPAPAVATTPDSGSYFRHTVESGARLRGVGGFRKGDELDLEEPAPTVMAEGMGGVARHQLVLEDAELPPDLDRYAIGREWDRLRAGDQSRRYFNLVKPDPDAPSPTVTQTGGVAGAAGVVHPTERRKFTIPELRRICGFPDDFVLTGNYRERWARLGLSVPPPMMAAVARVLAEVLCPTS